MSIKAEIDRIKQSKADIISALKSKGVTVPSDASIDDLSALVEAISTREDLSSELTTQNTLLTNQTSKLSSVVTALQGKASSGSGGSKLLSGGDIGFNRFEPDSTIIAGNLKITNDFDGTKQYKINLCSNVLFNSVMPDIYPAYSFNLNFSYEETDGVGAYLADITDDSFMPTYLGYLGITGYGSVTKGDVIVMPSYGIAMVQFDTTDTTTVPDFQLGVWLEEV